MTGADAEPPFGLRPRGMRKFLAGAGTIPRALGVLRRHPSLRRFVVVPVVLTLILGGVLYALLLVGGLALVDRLIGDPTGFGAVIAVLLRILLVVVLLLITGYLTVRLGVVLGSPWYSRLSAEVEHLQLGGLPPEQPTGMLRELTGAIAEEFRKLLVIAPLGFAVFLLGLVPVVGQIAAPFCAYALAGVIACLDFFDGPLERRDVSLRGKVRYIRTTLPASAGFATVAVPLLAFPLLNLASIPVLVVAGTLFWCERPGVSGPPAR